MTRLLDPQGSPETRRAFCAHACQIASLAVLGGAAASWLAACSASPTSPSNASSLPVVNGTLSGNSVAVTIDASSPLANVGGAALVQFSSGALLAVRSGQSGFTALSAICTHQTCTITGFSSQRFVCPCHGSEFDTSGNVVMGPAARSLAQFSTSFDGTVLTITT
jgi:cytochrome b6-f complex iron-sulfur subunit